MNILKSLPSGNLWNFCIYFYLNNIAGTIMHYIRKHRGKALFSANVLPFLFHVKQF